MRETRQIRLSRPIVVLGLAFLATFAFACSDENPGTTSSTSGSGGKGGTGGTGGGEGGAGGGTGGAGGTGGQSAGVKSAANGKEFSRPFDATPDPKGVDVYFTGLDPQGEAAIFRAKLDGSAPAAVLFAGDPLVTPLNLATSTDGLTVFITDTGADTGANNGDAGRIFKMPNDGGTPTAFPGADRYRPRGIEVVSENGKDMIYFAGTEPGGAAGIFKMTADGGGAVLTVKTGSPFVDPSGLVVTAAGDVYACDTTQEDGLDSLISVTSAGVATVVATGIHAGYPCGVSSTMDDKQILVSSLDASAGTSTVTVVDVATKAVTSLSMGINMNTESGGLHRAKDMGNVFAWCGATGGAGSTGTVYRVELP